MENIVTNALSWKYVLFYTLDTRLLGFVYVKELYPDDTNSVKFISNMNLQQLMDSLSMMDFYLKIKDYICLIVQCVNCFYGKAYDDGLMGYFRITKTLKVFHEYFCWPNMNKDV